MGYMMVSANRSPLTLIHTTHTQWGRRGGSVCVGRGGLADHDLAHTHTQHKLIEEHINKHTLCM